MPLFRCTKCGCVENTAISGYWNRHIKHRDGRHICPQEEFDKKFPPLCSECDPDINQWHDSFEKKSAVGYFVGADGFLYKKEQIKTIRHTVIVGYVSEKGITDIEKLKKLLEDSEASNNESTD